MDWILRHGASLMIFAGGLIAAVGAFFAERRATNPPSERPRHTWPAVILAGALIGGFGTYWGGYQQDQLSGFLLGADSYGYLSVGPQTSKAIDYLLVEGGNTPFYDVTIDIEDVTKWRDLWLKRGLPAKALDPNNGWKDDGSISTDDLMEIYNETRASIPVGNVGPGQVRSVWTTPPPTTDDEKYSISIWSRNGLITQELLLHRMGTGWTWATKVWRTSPQVKNGKQSKQSLEEIIRPDFPRKEVDWGAQ
jgi:hypothetical protein